MPVTYPDFIDWRASAKSTSHIAYAHGNSATLAGSEEPTTVRQGAVSAEVWPLLGIAPAIGRVFQAEEDQPGAAPVVVLSHATWTNQFQANPDILGRTITLDERTGADEVMITSSSRLVSAVVRLDGRAVGDAKCGPLTARLFAAMRADIAAASAARTDAVPA